LFIVHCLLFIVHCKVVDFNRQEFNQVLFQLSGGKEPLLSSLHVFPTITSTNETLWQLLDGGLETIAAVIALEQTAGRGQWGRRWRSPLGGLYLSLALSPKPNLVAKFAPHLTICTVWGIASNLQNYNIPAVIKWPNDLILQGKKLGGIKTETRVKDNKINRAVIGVGINWQNPVPEVGINLADFQQESKINSLNSLEMLGAIAVWGILSGYEHYLSVGIENLLPEYLQLLDSQGRTVIVEGCPGKVVGVTAQGELQVRLQSQGASTEICLPPGSISLGYSS